MFYEKINTSDAAVHVATVADAMFRGTIVSFMSGEKRHLPLHGHVVIDRQYFAVFRDEAAGLFEIYSAHKNKPGIQYVRTFTADKLNAFVGSLGLFQTHFVMDQHQ